MLQGIKLNRSKGVKHNSDIDLKPSRLPENTTILIADDEPDILEIISYNLRTEGYNILTAKNGNEAIDQAIKFNPSLIILDLMMPGKTGIEVCKLLRSKAQFKETLIIYLTAINDENMEIKGLEIGGDDYITKPISPQLLTSKVNALFRRIGKENETAFQFGNIMIDLEKYAIYQDGNEISLARKEFELIALLTSRPSKVFLRHEILQKVWGTEVIVGDRTIDVHIRKIRQKLGNDVITTIKGVGYKFDA